MIEILSTILLFVPAFLANATPVVVKNIPGLRTWNTSICTSIFGKNQTWRGLISGVLVANIASIFIFSFLGKHLPLEKNPVLVGLLLGLGALIGDLVESAIKRKMGRKPGAPLPFWDGADYILGALVFLAPIYRPGLTSVIILILISPLLSLIANSISYALGWKKVWW